MRIEGREVSPPLLEELKQLGGDHSRRELAHHLCTTANWVGANGELALMTARKVLARLTQLGHLPAPAHSGPRRGVPKPDDLGPLKPIACPLEDLNVEIVLLPPGRSGLSRQWNAMMDRDHYLGAGPLCGAQLRYLIRSGEDVLGGLAFSAAALQVANRDRWIGWSSETRRENLHLVVNNSRFLIAPHVEVPNLASHVMGRVLGRLARDWQERYGYEPVLAETFVEIGRFHGGCYRASNWQFVGATCGRTRQDTKHDLKVPAKALWVYPLREDFRSILQSMPEVRRLAPKPVAAPPPEREPVDWAEEEFGRAQLGDQRLVKRCCILARDFYARANAQIPQACGTRAKATAAWRFFGNPKVTMPQILQSHSEATVKRMAAEKVVLAVQDTTTLNYNAHPATEMLGPIGPKGDMMIGMLVHSTLAFNLSGTPLGLLDMRCWTRDPDDHGGWAKRVEWPLESKEAVRWLRGLEGLERTQSQCPDTQLVGVGDRESDIYELFVWALEKPGRPDILVRAGRQRVLADGQGDLRPYVEGLPEAGRIELAVPRKHKQRARIAQLSIRFAQVQLRPPARKNHLPSVSVWAVLAREEDPPNGIEPIEWMLLTTLPVRDLETAVEKLSWYGLRWGIEVFHRVLKSGCKIETRQLAGADCLEACLAIDAVVAWRIFYLTKVGREHPDLPCTVYFQDHEWKALLIFVTRNRTLPVQPPSLREAIRLVASLGGFLGRKSDGEPGTKTLWLGLQRLDDIALMYLAMTARPPPADFPAYNGSFFA